MRTFEIKEQFMLDGKEMKIISGAIHYFRVVPEYWRDRLEKLKAMGCNTVETYVPWNLHEPQKGVYDFSGRLDIKRFIETADELGLQVIVRPCPYICGEWEFGGLPYWLIKENGIHFRTNNDAFLNCVDAYYKELIPILEPLQITEGGPIIMMQVENEYGSYGDDHDYMLALEMLLKKYGIKVPLVTSDGPWKDYLACGGLENALPTANFGSKAKEQFGVLKKFTKGRPNMCMEFWVGWFDAWGDTEHHKVDYEINAKDLNDILSEGSVNIYMFHGGTNFGFMNGSNYYQNLCADVTSYDYDAPLSEDGQITPKYEAFKDVIAKYVEIPSVELTTKIKRKDYGMLTCINKVSLFSVLDDLTVPVHANRTLSMEDLDQGYGYVYYKSMIPKEQSTDVIRLVGANDRAHIFLDQQLAAIRYDKELAEEIKVDIQEGREVELGILMENMGRVNYGPNMEYQRKGISGGVLLDLRYRMSWEHYSLPLDQTDKIDFSKEYKEGTPAFYQFRLMADECCDTFLDLEGFGKGCAFLNGFNLGRFWEVGPQKRLYIPGPLLRKGENEIILFETDGKSAETIYLSDEGKLEP